MNIIIFIFSIIILYFIIDICKRNEKWHKRMYYVFIVLLIIFYLLTLCFNSNTCILLNQILNIFIFNIQLAIIYDAVHTVVIPSIKTPYDIFEECIINRRAYYHSKGGIKGLRYYALIGDNDINLKNSIDKTKSMMIECTNLKPTKNMIKNVYLSRNSSTTNKEKFMIYMFRLNPKFINKYMKYKSIIPELPKSVFK